MTHKAFFIDYLDSKQTNASIRNPLKLLNLNPRVENETIIHTGYRLLIIKQESNGDQIYCSPEQPDDMTSQ